VTDPDTVNVQLPAVGVNVSDTRSFTPVPVSVPDPVPDSVTEPVPLKLSVVWTALTVMDCVDSVAELSSRFFAPFRSIGLNPAVACVAIRPLPAEQLILPTGLSRSAGVVPAESSKQVLGDGANRVPVYWRRMDRERLASER
jgi:hypothetical protein